MKILQVIPYFVPAWDYGGPAPVCYELSKQLVRRGHEVTVYTTDALNASDRVGKQEEVIDGIRIRRFRNLSNVIAYKHNIFISPSMLLPMGELRKFDVIHMHEYQTLQNVLIHHRAVKLHIPYVLQAHGSLPIIGAKQNLKKLYNFLWGRRILRDASKLIALNRTEVGQYENMGVDKHRVEIVPNGIDLSEFENLPKRGEFRKKHGLSDNQKMVLYLGRIHQTKGLDLLAKAFAGLAQSFSDARLVAVGPDDGYLTALKKLIKELAIDTQVLFTDSLYGGEKLKAYIDADVFVTPSFSGFPITFMEACASGVPIVTTVKGDALDWLHNRVGYVTQYDVNELESAMTKILSDREIANKFQENGRKLTKEKFNWAKIVKQVEYLYLNCLRDPVNTQRLGRD